MISEKLLHSLMRIYQFQLYRNWQRYLPLQQKPVVFICYHNVVIKLNLFFYRQMPQCSNVGKWWLLIQLLMNDITQIAISASRAPTIMHCFRHLLFYNVHTHTSIFNVYFKKSLLFICCSTFGSVHSANSKACKSWLIIIFWTFNSTDDKREYISNRNSHIFTVDAIKKYSSSTRCNFWVLLTWSGEGISGVIVYSDPDVSYVQITNMETWNSDSGIICYNALNLPDRFRQAVLLLTHGGLKDLQSLLCQCWKQSSLPTLDFGPHDYFLCSGYTYSSGLAGIDYYVATTLFRFLCKTQ